MKIKNKDMKTAIINIKTDAKTKREAQKVAEELGFSLSSLVTASLRKIVRERRVEYILPEERQSLKSHKKFERAIKDYRAGKNTSPAFSNMEDYISYMKSL